MFNISKSSAKTLTGSDAIQQTTKRKTKKNIVYKIYKHIVYKNLLERGKCACNKQSSINRTHETPNKSSVVS